MTKISFNDFPVHLQASAYASESGVLTEAMIDEKVNDALISHSKKVVWQEDQTLYSYNTVTNKHSMPSAGSKSGSGAGAEPKPGTSADTTTWLLLQCRTYSYI